MATKHITGGDKRVQFVSSNLELLGFGNVRDALIQTVKELFENALDAVVTSSAQDLLVNKDSEAAEMLRMCVQWNPETGFVDVVCADTGTGMRAHQIRQLCCGVFETTKADSSGHNGVVSCGKYGLGLKAATLYSQLHVPSARLRVATTSDSSEILYIELGIDPESEEPAVVQHVERFEVDEGHRQFSGTEMRISVPAPECLEDVEYAADMLAVYFQSLRYTLQQTIGVEFVMNIGETIIDIGWAHGEQPIVRFAQDFLANTSDLVHASRACKEYNTNCMALFLSDGPKGGVYEKIEITVLRYANHVPLINADDFFLCSLTRGMLSNRVWKKLGYQCRRNSSILISQLIAVPTQSRRTPVTTPDAMARLVIAVDISVQQCASIKYTSMKKSALDTVYLKETQHCCRSILEQLHKRNAILSPRQTRDDELLVEYAPLVANAAASILTRSRQLTSSSQADVSMGQSPEIDRLTTVLQRILSQSLGHMSTVGHPVKSDL